MINKNNDMTKYNYKLTSKKGTVYYTVATDEKKARTSFQRKRNRYVDSYNSISYGVIECLGETEESKAQSKSEENGLLDKLFETTKVLKEEYIKKTIEWAGDRWERSNDNVSLIAGKIKEMETELYAVVKAEGFFNSYPWSRKTKNVEALKLYNKIPELRREQSKEYTIANQDKQKFIDNMEKKAIDHYNNSIIKLALRIEKKGLDQSKIEMTTGYVSQNIETTITDGAKTVRAWTIIASGPIQRPHYRYLVK